MEALFVCNQLEATFFLSPDTYLGGDCDVMEFCLSSCRNLAIADMGFAGPTVLVVTVNK